ncbi:MAG TPA: preprotein translocase subunit YajC [Verrucomicrobiae bacterium]|jgi:preprotein translocase subunit YajC|nr:preprotein translocase subunit YajC [Verrucomicrobiae bacterium]
MMMRFFASILLLAQQSLMAVDAAAPAAKPQQMVPDPRGMAINQFLVIGLLLVVMWVFLFAPQRKRAKELEATLKALKAGDKVVTNSGILGVVLSIKDKTLSIRSAESKLEVLKSSVLEVIERGGEPSESKS